MSDNSPTTTSVGKRVTILDSIGEAGDGSNGQTLRGQNVQNFPEGTLFYVRKSNRMYRLKKNMAIAVAEDTSGMFNVINGIGSTAPNGRFVACVQMGIGTLVPGGEGLGSQVVLGSAFDVNPGGWFHISYQTFGDNASTGALRAEATTETHVTAFSDSDTDNGAVFVTYWQTPESE